MISPRSTHKRYIIYTENKQHGGVSDWSGSFHIQITWLTPMINVYEQLEVKRCVPKQTRYQTLLDKQWQLSSHGHSIASPTYIIFTAFVRKSFIYILFVVEKYDAVYIWSQQSFYLNTLCKRSDSRQSVFFPLFNAWLVTLPHAKPSPCGAH